MAATENYAGSDTVRKRRILKTGLFVGMMLALTLFAVGCSKPKVVATPTAAATGTPKLLSARQQILATVGLEFPTRVASVTSTPTQVVQAKASLLSVSRVPVQWVDAPSPMKLTQTSELADPFADDLRTVSALQKMAYGPNDAVIYVGDGTSPPRQVYATHRQLYGGPKWAGGKLTANFLTRRNLTVAGLATTPTWLGSLEVDPKTGIESESSPAFPAQTDLGQNGAKNIAFKKIDAEHATLVLNLPVLDQLRSHAKNGFYLINTRDEAKRLVGLDKIQLVGLLANGVGFFATTNTRAQGNRQPPMYLIPPKNGEAYVIKDVIEEVPEDYSSSGAWMGRILFVVEGDSAGYLDFDVFDPVTFKLTTVVTARVSLPKNPVIGWLKTAGNAGPTNDVRVGDQVLDLTTGKLSPLPPTPVPTTQPASYPPDLVRVPAPGGRPNAVIEVTQKTPFSCSSLSLETDNGKVPLATCVTGRFYDPRWLDATHMVVTQQSHQSARVALIDADSASLTWLNDDLEEWAPKAVVSPDGNRFVIGGSKLKVYSSSGELLQTFVPPDRISVTDIAWSPDGSQFAFLTGPTRCLNCGP